MIDRTLGTLSLSAASAVLACLILATSATATPATATRNELFDPMMRALGGREAIADIRSMSVEAICSGPGGPFYTEVHSLPAGSGSLRSGTYFRQVGENRVTEIWSTPEATWSLADDGSVHPLPDPVRSFLRGHEFHLQLFEVEERFSDHRLGAREKFAEQPSRRIEMIDEAGAPATLWLSEEDHLPLALQTHPEGAAGPVRVVFADWSTLEGIRLFQSFELTEGTDRLFRYDYVRTELGTPLESLFERPGNIDSERQALEEILSADRRAHIETDAQLMAGHLAESLIEVSAGAITTRSRREIIDFFTGSFDGATFHSWDDSSPPVIRFSPDLRMAWVVRRVTADREDLRDGVPVRTRYTSAYTATYEKRDSRWRMTSVTSTFVPPS